MKRRTFKLCMFLLLGAILNVAVAWGCASYAPTGDEVEVGAEAWHNFKPLDWPDEPTYAWEANGIAITVKTDEASGPDPNGHWVGDEFVGQRNPDLYRFAWFTVGWPMRSMHWSLYEMMPDARGTLDFFPSETQGLWVSGLDPFDVSDDEWRHQRRLPLAILRPGFAINTIFYAAMVWMLFAFSSVARRRIRAHRGRCTGCGYDLRGRGPEQNLCPECGARVSKRS